MKKIAIIGASYLQNPLILKAKEMGLETHVFAWKAGDIGETTADFFYPISITEKEEILEKCKEIGIDGICSIASDLAMLAVNYVAVNMGLSGNTLHCTEISTNKYRMRQALRDGGLNCPGFVLVDDDNLPEPLGLEYPIIVKPTDRSGSRGVSKLKNNSGLMAAIGSARDVSFEKRAIVEEFIEGKEYSVECISYQGKHTLLAVTEKFTTGAPNFIETGHLEPAGLSISEVSKVKDVVYKALDVLEIANGASHSEIMIRDDGSIYIVEIGGRMGGDCIGSSLVELSTGIDFVKAVIDVALGKEPDLTPKSHHMSAGIKFVLNKADLERLETIKENHKDLLIESSVEDITDRNVVDSSTRFGYCIVAGNDADEIRKLVE
jgi:biotin carboxylase